MGTPQARLERIESQRFTDACHNLRRLRKNFPTKTQILDKLRSLASPLIIFFQTGGEGTESAPESSNHLFDLPGEYVPMSPEIYSAVSEGNRDWLEILEGYGTPMACLRSDKGESVLQLAASWDHLDIVKSIILKCPCLLLEPNSMDQLPIHVAALAGNSAVVETLIKALAFVSAKLSTEARDILNVYVVKDINGHTALHLALEERYMNIAARLVNEDQQAALLEDKDGISPLYLAVNAGNVSLVKAMLKITGADYPQRTRINLESQLEGKKCLAHAALNSWSTDILDVILEEYPSLVDELDGKGRTCLSFGASIGFYKGVCNLLDRSRKDVFVCDSNGSFPIHVAIENGNGEIVRAILKRCPDSIQLRNKKGQNILHVAAASGYIRILYHLTTLHRAKRLANEKDENGNTPLHLATLNWWHRAISRLAGPKNLSMRNKNGLTPFGIAESNLQRHYIYRERLTVMVLVYWHVRIDQSRMKFMKLARSLQPMQYGSYKDYINALLLVAALIATVTFTACFTLPGGFKSSNPNLGMANLATDIRLIFFLCLDTIAMLSSVVAIFKLISAQMGDPELYQSSMQFAMPALLGAVCSMTYAFLVALLIAAGNVRVLFWGICVVMCCCSFVMVFILVPHVILQQSDVHANWGSWLFFVSIISLSDTLSDLQQAFLLNSPLLLLNPPLLLLNLLCFLRNFDRRRFRQTNLPFPFRNPFNRGN